MCRTAFRKPIDRYVAHGTPRKLPFATGNSGSAPVATRAKKDFPRAAASAREFRVILLCSTVLFGAQMAATPSRPADLF